MEESFVPVPFIGSSGGGIAQVVHRSAVEQVVSLTAGVTVPARIMKNKSKMKELEWSQDFAHYNPMGAICCHGNQSSDPI